jgi:hypothetical protein
MMREVTVPDTDNFRGVCPISNRAIDKPARKLRFPAVFGARDCVLALHVRKISLHISGFKNGKGENTRDG